ncbi:DUF433 domain-containing protein [Nodularia chucula]|uniref:DUF433 domain-containing protein n=1 Tax=Nodularia chucula TaxID=3093667 RepID=UPI0039C616B6
MTIEPGKRGGKPCIRGMRITVYEVLSYLASGMTNEEILNDFPWGNCSTNQIEDIWRGYYICVRI